MDDFLNLIHKVKTASPSERRAVLSPEANSANIGRVFLALKAGKDIRAYLRALSDLAVSDKLTKTISRYAKIHSDTVGKLLCAEDPKTRKLAAEFAGKCLPDEQTEALIQALESETTDFVRPSQILALGNSKDPRAKAYLETYAIPHGEEKHMAEQSLALKKALSSVSDRPKTSIHPLPERTVLLLYCPSPTVAKREVEALGYAVKPSPYPFDTIAVEGVEKYRRIFAARSFYRAHILYQRYPSLEGAMDAARSQGFAKFAHTLFGEDVLPFRLELSCERGCEPKEGRRKAAETIAQKIDAAGLGLFMSPSAYLFEIHLHLTAKGNVLSLLPSPELDDRFAYKKEGVAASIHPAAAAACIQFIKAFLYADANILDCFCGSGTMLFERARLPHATLTGSDISPTAIRIARSNEKLAKTGAQFFAKNACDPFREQYDEVLCNMPFGLRVGSHRENQTLYQNFLENLKNTLTPRGRAFLFTHEKKLLEAIFSEHFTCLARHKFACGGLYPAIYVLQPKKAGLC